MGVGLQTGELCCCRSTIVRMAMDYRGTAHASLQQLSELREISIMGVERQEDEGLVRAP